VLVILSHASQFESVVGNVAEYQHSRLNQDVMVLDFTHEQLKDVNQLNQLLENLRAAKRHGQVIIVNRSLLDRFQLALQEVCNSRSHKKLLEPPAKKEELKAENSKKGSDQHL
jgi:hypothetical protein